MRSSLPDQDLNHILAAAGPLWSDLRNARLFVSGGTGFFGRWLLESLLRANQVLDLNVSLLVLTRNPSGFAAAVPHVALAPGVSLLAGDVTSFSLPGQKCDFVIHAATDTPAMKGTGSWEAGRASIVAGTRHMLNFARAAGARSFLFTSSGAVYGKQPSGVSHVPEDYTDTAPDAIVRSGYGQGKWESEALCEEYSSRFGLHCKLARCFAFVGPCLPLDSTYAIGNFIRDALENSPVRVAGDGTAFRSYLYAADLALWLWTILLRGTTCRPYNVGSEADLTIGALAHRVSNLLGGQPVEIAAQPTPGTFPDRYVPSTRRARTELALREAFSLDDAILATSAWNSGCTQQ